MDTVYPPRPVYIYALVDPETDEVRYVGQTLRPKDRLRRHLMPCFLKRPGHKNAWLRDLVARGLQPSLRILEEATTLDWGEAERCWITHYRELGAPLTNLTAGGDGTLGYVFPPDVRARMSEANKGQRLSPEHAAKLRESAHTRVWTPEMRAKMSRASAGRTMSAEARAKMSAARVARVVTPEQRERQRQVMLAIRNDPVLAAKREAARLVSNRTPEFRAKISATQKGRPKSPEHCAKISAACKGRRRSAEEIARQVVAANATKARKKAERLQESGQLCLFTKHPADS